MASDIDYRLMKGKADVVITNRMNYGKVEEAITTMKGRRRQLKF